MVLPTSSTQKTSRSKISAKLLFALSLVFIVCIALINAGVYVSSLNNELTELRMREQSIASTMEKACIEANKQWFEKDKPLITEFPTLSQRNDIIAVLEKLKWKTAIEVGVQKGLFAKKMLDNWPSCTEYKLVDLWGKEDGYQEPGNFDHQWHDNAYKETVRRVTPYKEKVEFFVMRSTDAAKKIQDNHFDFVYLDARHDYCAVADDIEHYWPKVRPGGILAGHDFIDAQYALEKLGENQNWGLCEDGTEEPRAVRGAVEDFAKKEKIDFILVSQEGFPSWFIQKPYD